MTYPIDGFEESGETSVLSPLFAVPNPQHVEEDERATRTNRMSKEVFAALAPYMAGNTVLANHITPPTDEAGAVARAAASTGVARAAKNNRLAKMYFTEAATPIVGTTIAGKEPPPPPAEDSIVEAAPEPEKGSAAGFPNLGWEILKAGLLKESFMIHELNTISDGIEKIQEKLAKILSFNQKLTKLPSDKDDHPITDEMREDIRVLKEMGIDLLSADEKSISGEKLAMMKTDLDGFKSKFQTDMQSGFMNSQTKSSQYNSLIESLRTVDRHMSRLLQKILDNMKK